MQEVIDQDIASKVRDYDFTVCICDCPCNCKCGLGSWDPSTSTCTYFCQNYCCEPVKTDEEGVRCDLEEIEKTTAELLQKLPSKSIRKRTKIITELYCNSSMYSDIIRDRERESRRACNKPEVRKRFNLSPRYTEEQIARYRIHRPFLFRPFIDNIPPPIRHQNSSILWGLKWPGYDFKVDDHSRLRKQQKNGYL
jgi:hypothetical protein